MLFTSHRAQLLKSVQARSKQLNEEIEQIQKQSRRRGQTQDLNLGQNSSLELINMILNALEKENSFLFQWMVQLVKRYIGEKQYSQISRAKHPYSMEQLNELVVLHTDLDKLDSDDLTALTEWLVDKIDDLSQ